MAENRKLLFEDALVASLSESGLKGAELLRAVRQVSAAADVSENGSIDDIAIAAIKAGERYLDERGKAPNQSPPAAKPALGAVGEADLVARFGRSASDLSPTNRIILARQIEAERLPAAATVRRQVVPTPTVAEMVAIHGSTFTSWQPVQRLRALHVEMDRRTAVAKAAAA